MKNTKQKMLITQIVNNSCNHPTAHDIYIACRKDIPNISLGTVYRNLNTLVENSIIKRIKCDNNIDRYDKFDNKHIHLICINCNNVIDVFEKINLPKIDNSFEVVDYELNIKGLCPNCKRKEEK